MFTLKNNSVDARDLIQAYFWIVNKDRKRVPFLLNNIQNKFYDEQTHYDIIIKPRKPGISSLILAEWAISCIMCDNVHAVVMSHEEDATRHLLDRVYYYINNLAQRPKLGTASKNEIQFTETNSYFWIGTAGSRAFGRGDDITHFHASEFDWWKKPDVFDGAMEACVPDAYRVIETTANGYGSQAHKIWLKAY